MELPGIRGKVAIVTGAGGGIGEAYAKGLAGAGARVAVADVAGDAAERVAREIAAEGSEAMALTVDVASPEATRRMADETAARFGGIDFLVNNAAIFGGMQPAPFVEVDWEYYTRFMTTSLRCSSCCPTGPGGSPGRF